MGTTVGDSTTPPSTRLLSRVHNASLTRMKRESRWLTSTQGAVRPGSEGPHKISATQLGGRHHTSSRTYHEYSSCMCMYVLTQSPVFLCLSAAPSGGGAQRPRQHIYHIFIYFSGTVTRQTGSCPPLLRQDTAQPYTLQLGCTINKPETMACHRFLGLLRQPGCPHVRPSIDLH